MFKRIISLTIISLAFSIEPLRAQARLEGQFFEYTSYYLSNFNVNTGESDVPLFRYRIRSDTYPIYTKIWFSYTIKIYTTIFKLIFFSTSYMIIFTIRYFNLVFFIFFLGLVLLVDMIFLHVKVNSIFYALQLITPYF